MWDVNDQVFWVDPHILKLELEDIYFLMGLSKRGEAITFSGHQGSEYSTDDYIDEFCRVGACKVSGKIPIKDVTSLPLRTILFTLTKLEGSTGPNLALKSQMALAIECLELKMFSWSHGLLVNLKDQLNKCRAGGKNNLGMVPSWLHFFLSEYHYCDHR